jgi:hypothetical protein
MGALVLDIFDDIGHGGLRHGENSIAVLPSEMTEVSELPVNPKGRIAFQEFGGLAWRDRCRRADEHVCVVVDAANLYSDHFMFTSTAADASPDIVFDLRPDKIKPIFGAKDEVKVNL